VFLKLVKQAFTKASKSLICCPFKTSFEEALRVLKNQVFGTNETKFRCARKAKAFLRTPKPYWVLIEKLKGDIHFVHNKNPQRIFVCQKLLSFCQSPELQK